MSSQPVSIAKLVMRAVAVAIAAAPACWWVFGQVEALTEAHLRNVVTVFTSVSVTMLGFTLAMLAVLVSISSTRIVRNMNRTGHYDLIVLRLFISAGMFGAVLVSALVCLFLFGQPFVVGVAISSGFMVGACVAMTISTYKFWLLLKLLHADKSGSLE